MSKAAVDLKFKTEGACRLCRRPASVRALTRHRIVPGYMGGRYVPKNCVPLCRPCHDLVDNRRMSERAIARRMLRASLWPEEHARAERVLSPVMFDWMYPPPSRELVLERRGQYATAS